MKIAIIGTRGIPNNYGGFEQFAEYLSLGLVKKGHDVTVYNSHLHPYKESIWNGVKIEHIYDFEHIIGTAGQFVYDFLSILNSRKKDFDIILELGYTSSAVFFDMHPKNSIVITNMDGLEWKRSKYSKYVQKFLLYSESLAAKNSDYLVSDSIGIKSYLMDKYSLESYYIPYGAYSFNKPDKTQLQHYNLQEFSYSLLIARLEPENSIEMILDGVVNSDSKTTFLVIGKNETKYGKYLKKKYELATNIHFINGIYDMNMLNNLRYFSRVYFHGHTVGGTNPSLLEAMASNSLICAHKNQFNSAILGDDSFYFSSSTDVTDVLNSVAKKEHESFLKNNLKKIDDLYSWEKIINDYERLFEEALTSKV